tara:strand:+ start:771 stop:1592 length:822 start_codon:yes stop_codon:yes gene_type:complete
MDSFAATISATNGAFLHDSLVIKKVATLNRGVFSSSLIPKTSRLFTIPANLVIGPKPSRLPPAASPWLSTVVNLMLAMISDEKTNYLTSLPAKYDTLLDWTDSEISLLKGTDLHEIITSDRTSGSYFQNFKNNIQPHLTPLNDSRLDFELFKLCSTAVVTRGFHTADNTNNEAIAGPFLIPLVDLLNHEHSPTRRCTVLQRDVENNFFMNAERDILPNEVSERSERVSFEEDENTRGEVREMATNIYILATSTTTWLTLFHHPLGAGAHPHVC